ncbi:MAG: hypothetical protein ACOZNI_24955 [Myxococcota bacterium]
MPDRKRQPSFDQDYGRDPDIGKEDRHGRVAVGRRGTVGSENASEQWEGGDVGEEETSRKPPPRKPLPRGS